MRRSGARGSSSRQGWGRLLPTLALSLGCALTLGAPAVAEKADRAAKEQLSFGVDMARRGLWNEALFRFEQVRKSLPNDPRVLNNLAVAYEAVGRFEEAETLYNQALQVA